MEMHERSDESKPATEHARRGFRALMWTLLALIAVIVMVLALWGRHAQNGTSTVNPTKTPPAAHQ
jgi:uracil DNA glycosylase